MADTPLAPSSEVSTPPSSAADQARIRKERREAKIRAGGSARLNKITGLGGGVQREAPVQPSVADPTADPEEVDISQHFYTPTTRTSRSQDPSANASNTSSPQMTDDQLRALMLGNPIPQTGNFPPSPNQNPFAGFPGMEGLNPGGPNNAADDPMMQMLQQMMGSMGGGDPSAAGPGGMPSFPGMPSMGMPGQAGAAGATDPYAYIWRIIHAIFAFSLGVYIAMTSPIAGTKLARDLSALPTTSGINTPKYTFFYIFATAEVLLQSSRFLLEKQRGLDSSQQAGVLGMVMGFLPPPYGGYLKLALRYFRVWTVVSADAMVCLFIVGVACWFSGGTA